MRSQTARAALLLVAFTMVIGIVFAACSNPLSDADPADEEVAAAAPTSTTAPPMRIVTPTPVDATAVAAASPTPVEERPDRYIVEENDTLYGIAARYNVEISRLVEVNGLSDPNDIWIGQELIIPPLD